MMNLWHTKMQNPGNLATFHKNHPLRNKCGIQHLAGSNSWLSNMDKILIKKVWFQSLIFLESDICTKCCRKLRVVKTKKSSFISGRKVTSSFLSYTSTKSVNLGQQPQVQSLPDAQYANRMQSRTRRTQSYFCLDEACSQALQAHNMSGFQTSVKSTGQLWASMT